jgi:anti-sigma-K factor RskA
MSEHEEIENAIAAWVLGATDPDEAEKVATHVEGCATCRATVARLRGVIDAIPLAVEEAEPTPQLRQRILAAASAETPAATARSDSPVLRLPRRRRPITARLVGRVPLMAAAHASVIDLKSDGIAFVDFTGLPAPGPGNVYELWLIGPANRVDAAGVFIPDGNGSRVVVVSRPLAGYATMAVTTEQGPNGVAAPTQQPQLAGSIA